MTQPNQDDCVHSRPNIPGPMPLDAHCYFDAQCPKCGKRVTYEREPIAMTIDDQGQTSNAEPGKYSFGGKELAPADEKAFYKAVAAWMESHGFEWWEIDSEWFNPKLDITLTQDQALFFYTICQKVEREARFNEVMLIPEHKNSDGSLVDQLMPFYKMQRIAQLIPPQDTTKQEEES